MTPRSPGIPRQWFAPPREQGIQCREPPGKEARPPCPPEPPFPNRQRTPAAAIVLLTAVVLAMSTPLVWAGLVADQPDTAVLAPPRVAIVGGDDDAPGGP